jgi:hypothetical protein
MSERVYTFDTEIGGRVVRIEYRAPERGIEPTRVLIRYVTYCPSHWLEMQESVAIHEACEADWRDRVEAQIDEEADAALERKRDSDLS